MKLIGYFSCPMWKRKWCMLICLPDVATACPDKKSILMYVTSLFQVLPQQVTMEAIREVEMLPRHTRVTREERIQVHHQERFSHEVSCFTFLLSFCCSKVVVSLTYPVSLNVRWPIEGQKTGLNGQSLFTAGKSNVLVCINCTFVLLFILHWAVLKVTIQQISALHFSFTALGILIVEGKNTNWGKVYI